MTVDRGAVLAVVGDVVQAPAADRFEHRRDVVVAVGLDGVITAIEPRASAAGGQLIAGAGEIVELGTSSVLMPGLVDLHVHDTFAAFETASAGARLHLLSTSAQKSYLDARFAPGDVLVFGCESNGLPQALLDRHAERCLAIPTSGPVRSLNLSNAVAIVLFEAQRQLGALQNCSLQE